MATPLGEAWVNIGANTAPLTAGLQSAKGQVQGATVKMQTQLKTIGTTMTLVGAVVTAAFALTVKSAIGFQKQLAQVSTMLDKSAMSIMPEYKKELLAMSAAFGEGTDTLSRGLYDILSASIEPTKALDVLREAARAATAGITDTGTAADAITTILNSYGMSADKAGDVSDKLFAIVKRGKLTFADLAPSIGKVAATAAKTGLSFEELGASIATITRAGIRTEEAMTAINGILRAFLKPTDDAKKASAEFGLVMDTNTLKTIGLKGAMEKLTTATAEQLAQIFPNIRGLKGIISAMGDLEGYTKDYALMLNSAGLTEEAFAKQSATLGFKIDQLKKSFSVIITTMGDKLIPVVQSIVVSIGKVTAAVAKWMEKNPQLTATLVKLGAALGVFTMVGGLLILGALYFTKLSTTIMGIQGAVKLVIPALGKLKIALTGVGGVALLVGANIIIWSEVWKAYQEVMDSARTTTADVEAAQANLAKAQEKTASKLGLTVEKFKEYQEAGMSVTEMIKRGTIASESHALAMADLIEKAKEGKISASELYQAFLDLGGVTKETTEDTKTIATTVKDLNQVISLLSKEYDASNKSISESIGYYTQMIEKVNQVDVILQTELTLLKEGTEEWYKKKEEIADNTKLLNELTISLQGLTEPLEGLDLIAAKMALLGDSIEEIPARLELLREKAVLLKGALDEAIPDTKAWWEAKTAFEANQEAIDNLVGSFDEFGEKGKALLASLIELTDKQKKLQEAIDVVGVDKQSEAYRYLKIEYNANEAAIASLITQLNNLEKEQREAEQATKDLADAYKTVTDKIYELTHTPMEVAIRKLDQQKQAYLDLGMEIGIVNKWYDLQIAKLKELYPELDDTTEKLKEATEATVKLGILGGKSWEGFTTQIRHATAELSNFTKEGVAAAIAQIKMKFMPLILSTIEVINTGLGLGRRMAEYQLAELRKAMQEQIDLILYGFDVYNEELNKLGGAYDDVADSARGAADAMENATEEGLSWYGMRRSTAEKEEKEEEKEGIPLWLYKLTHPPSFQVGTPFVPKTGMAMLHRGEAVVPANQNTYNNSFSPTVNLSVQGGGSPKSIAQEVENVLYDMGRQFKRRGFEIIPGRG